MPFDCTPTIDASRSSAALSHGGLGCGTQSAKAEGSCETNPRVACQPRAGVCQGYADGLASFSSMKRSWCQRSFDRCWLDTRSVLTPAGRRRRHLAGKAGDFLANARPKDLADPLTHRHANRRIMSRWGRIAGVADLQGWRTLAEVAKELGVTDRTLQRRLAEAGIRPARPGRTPMLSDADVTKLMDESRRRSGSPKSAPAPR